MTDRMMHAVGKENVSLMLNHRERRVRDRPFHIMGCWDSTLLIIGMILIFSSLIGCTWNIDLFEYTPLNLEDWEVSTPEEQGLDPNLVSELYFNAAKLETLYGLLVIKNGYLVAERYFNTGSVDQLSGRQSATKSFTSALVGIALDQGTLSSVNQKMMDFFPEFAEQIDDPRKEAITIQDLLQMRSGYPDEEHTSPYFDILLYSNNWHWLPHLVHFPLTTHPGTEFQYSNLTSHILGIIVARACGTDLESYAQEHLFSPMGAVVGDWTRDADNYNFGCFEIYVTARDMAKFGMMYLNHGMYRGNRILPADWIRDSLQRYSENIKRGGKRSSRYGNFRDLGYGYQWWSSKAGEHYFDYASGHGGNLIVLLQELDMIIVTAADPLHYLPSGGESWKHEGAIVNMIGKFIKSLPNE